MNVMHKYWLIGLLFLACIVLLVTGCRSAPPGQDDSSLSLDRLLTAYGVTEVVSRPFGDDLLLFSNPQCTVWMRTVDMGDQGTVDVEPGKEATALYVFGPDRHLATIPAVGFGGNRFPRVVPADDKLMIVAWTAAPLDSDGVIRADCHAFIADSQQCREVWSERITLFSSVSITDGVTGLRVRAVEPAYDIRRSRYELLRLEYMFTPKGLDPESVRCTGTIVVPTDDLVLDGKAAALGADTLGS